MVAGRERKGKKTLRNQRRMCRGDSKKKVKKDSVGGLLEIVLSGGAIRGRGP